MVQSQYSLSWDAYKNSICNGFSSLQQNGEFVDMTLAADGHFVKVHQVLIALASPYLKELITSAPCQHPVIFLNNVTSKTLSCLLEYIYTGEVLVPSENLMSFIETAKALHIQGLENLDSNDRLYKVVDNLAQVDGNMPCHMSGMRSLEIPGDGGTGKISLPAAARKVFVKPSKGQSESAKKASTITLQTRGNIKNEQRTEYSEMMDSTDIHDDDDVSSDGLDTSDAPPDKTVPEANTTSSNLQFSVSIRGSLQVILNRYIYNMHSLTSRTGVRRWRCVEYRNHRCKAFVVTKGNVVLNRANLHNHSFHDKKILQKIEKKAVFSALDDIQNYKEQEENADKQDSMEQDEFIGVELDYNIENSKKSWNLKENN